AGPPIKFPAEAKAADEEPAAPVFAPEQRPRIRPPRAARPARPARAERDAPSRPRAAPATGIGLGELSGRAGPAPPARAPRAGPAPRPEPRPEVGAGGATGARAGAAPRA